MPDTAEKKLNYIGVNMDEKEQQKIAKIHFSQNVQTLICNMLTR